MKIKFRQKKQSPQEPNLHPTYSNAPQHWADKYREENKEGFNKSFFAVIVVMAIIMIILIVSVVTTFSSSASTQQITAADTFSITQYEQDDMKNKSKEFAKDILTYAYCSDQDMAMAAKSQALNLMANNTEAYTSVEQLAQVDPIVAPQNFAPVILEPQLQNATMAYASSFDYKFKGVVADMSQTSEENPDGTFVDNGYDFTLTFSYVTDSKSGEQTWVISDVSIVSAM